MIRVRWQTTNETRPGSGRLRIVLQSAVSGRLLTVAADQQGPGSGESVSAQTSPIMYAVVESSDIDWGITVEEGLLASIRDSASTKHPAPR